jgi:hypothetical protein
MTIWKICLGLVVLVVLGACSQDGEPVDRSMQGIGGGDCFGFPGGGGPGMHCECFRAVADTQIDTRETTWNFGSSTTCAVDADPEISCLFKFDLSVIPTNAIVGTGTVNVNVVDSSTTRYAGQRLLTTWSETQATWQKATSSDSWATPGAKTDRAMAALFTFSGSLGARSGNLTDDGVSTVQSWVTTPSSNKGVVISSTDTHRMMISTKENGPTSAPLLCMMFNVP